MSTITETTPPPFPASRTCRALSDAYLREAAAGRFYLAAACQMEDAALHVIAHALRFTAAQEQEHEAVFRGLLTVSGAAVPRPAEETAPLPAAPEALLAAVIQAEAEEAEQFCPQSALLAAQEGYPRIADAFRRIGETQAQHARRFRQYARALADGSLFRDESRVSWFCLGCGQLHTGCEAPLHCTSCSRDRGHFIRSNHHPFLVGG